MTSDGVFPPDAKPRRRLRAAVRAVVAAVALVAALVALPRATASFTALTDNGANSFGSQTLDPPTALVATSTTVVSLDWTATVDTFATGHRIYRATSPGGPYVPIADVTPRTTVNYVDDPPPGTYFYIARAYLGTWESIDSNEDTGGTPFACPAADPNLRACYRFDADLGGTYLDESSYGNTVTVTNGSLVPGVVGSAADSVPGARYEVTDSASLDLTTGMTIEAWLRFDSAPSSGRYGALDNDGQYGVFLHPGGLQCTNGIGLSAFVAVPIGLWFHLGCTWNGSTLTVYIDDQPGVGTAVSGTRPTANTNNIALLDTSPGWTEPMNGSMDNLRIWHVARTQAQICTDAGIAGC